MRKFVDEASGPLALYAKTRADLLALLFGEEPKPNYELDGACVLTITGPLEHHLCGADKDHPWGFGDSYDAIRMRFADALEYRCVVMRVCSPGGVVSGLNETVRDLRKMAKAAGKPVYVYADEMIASAAYALATIGDEVYGPGSALIGSIGVISQLVSQKKMDQKIGLDFEIITSGTRKADGHAHAEITAGAIAAEQGRVDDLAQKFFRLVANSRGGSPADYEALQAGIFLGVKAVRAGLSDGVLGWNAMLEQIGLAPPAIAVTDSETQKRLDTQASAHGAPMILKLKALMASAEKSLATEKDPAKLMAIAADLQSYKHTYKKITEEKETREGGEEEEAEEEGEEEGAEEKFPEKDGKKAEKAEKDDGDDDGDDDDDDDGADEKKAEEEEKKAAASLRKQAASSRGDTKKALLASAATLEASSARRAALSGEVKSLRSVQERIAKLEARTDKSDVGSIVAKALDATRITPAEAKTLRTKPMGYVSAFLAARPKGAVRKTRVEPNTDADVSAFALELGAAPDDVTATISAEMKEAADRLAMLSSGKITAEAALNGYTESQAKKAGKVY